MSKLRPECGDSKNPAMSDESVLFLLRDAINRRGGLIHGRLHDGRGGHCAMGSFWEDNPKTTVSSRILDEVATVNDSLGPKATPRQRFLKVRSWVRFKLWTLGHQTPGRPPKATI